MQHFLQLSLHSAVIKASDSKVSHE